MSLSRKFRSGKRRTLNVQLRTPDALSAILTVSQLSKSFAGRALFDDVSLQVNLGDRIGLVGPNGLDNGTIAIEKNATIGFLPQETAFQVRETLSAFVGGNDEPVSIVAVHSNIAFDFVELKLDAVLHDG